MIRIGPATSGVSSIFNSFHSTDSTISDFYTNADGSDPPPPTGLTKCVGSQFTSAPLLRLNATIFIDPYGIETVPTAISTFYTVFTAETSVDFSLQWANQYSGDCKSVLPDGFVAQSEVYFEANDLFYLRLNNRNRPYRVFFLQSGVSILEGYFVGPENAPKITGNSSGYQLGGLKGTECLYMKINSYATNFVEYTKEEGVFDPTTSDVQEAALSGSYPTRWKLVRFYYYK